MPRSVAADPVPATMAAPPVTTVMNACPMKAAPIDGTTPVVGASKQVETIQISELLAQLAWRYRGEPSGVCDLRDLSMRLIDYQAAELRSQVASGMRLVVSLRSVFENPTSAPIARETDAVVVCIALGETKFKQVEETLAAVGRERVVGSIVLRPKRKPTGR